MSTLSANVTDVNLVLKECTHKIEIKYSVHKYCNSYAYFRQLAHCCACLICAVVAVTDSTVVLLIALSENHGKKIRKSRFIF